MGRGRRGLGRGLFVVVVHEDKLVGQLEVGLDVGHRLPVEHHVVALALGQLAQQPGHAAEDRGRDLVLLADPLALGLAVDLLELVELPLPVFEGPLQRLFREHLGLLLDVFFLLGQLFLPDIQLDLPALEELAQRRLGAQAVFGLHDGALHVDDADAQRTRVGGVARRGHQRGREARGGQGQGGQLGPQLLEGAHFFLPLSPPLFPLSFSGFGGGSGGSGCAVDSLL